jgi:hypothetical protein
MRAAIAADRARALAASLLAAAAAVSSRPARSVAALASDFALASARRSSLMVWADASAATAISAIEA